MMYATSQKQKNPQADAKICHDLDSPVKDAGLLQNIA